MQHNYIYWCSAFQSQVMICPRTTESKTIQKRSWWRSSYVSTEPKDSRYFYSLNRYIGFLLCKNVSVTGQDAAQSQYKLNLSLQSSNRVDVPYLVWRNHWHVPAFWPMQIWTDTADMCYLRWWSSNANTSQYIQLSILTCVFLTVLTDLQYLWRWVLNREEGEKSLSV